MGVTVREAIDDEAKYERDQAELVAKLASGVGRAFDVAGRVLAGALPSAPGVGTATPLPAGPERAAAPASPTVAPPVAPPSPTLTAPTTAPAAPEPPSTTSPEPLSTGPSVTPPMGPPPSLPVPARPLSPVGSPAGAAMTPEQFARFVESVEETPFAHDRVARAKAMPAGQRVTTAQSVALAQTVPHPSLQVEVLAALYPRVTDPENFELAYATLSFPDDRERLRNRVRALR